MRPSRSIICNAWDTECAVARRRALQAWIGAGTFRLARRLSHRRLNHQNQVMANPMTTPSLPIDDLAPAEPSNCRFRPISDAIRRIITRLLALAAFIALWELSTNKIHFLINFAHVGAKRGSSFDHEFAQAPKSLRHIANSARRVRLVSDLPWLTAVPLGPFDRSVASD